jgi:arginase
VDRWRRTNADWTVIGAPIDSGGDMDAEVLAPAALRDAGLVERVGARDSGDVAAGLRDRHRDANTGVIGVDDLVRFSQELRARVAAVAAAGERPLVIGGDCSFLIGLFAGLRDAGVRPGLWFIDGHADFYDGRSSPSGEAADMELAILTGHGPDILTGLAGDAPLVDPQEVMIIGHRPESLDADVAEELGFVPDAIDRVDSATIRERGGAAVGRDAAERMSHLDSVWVHLDLDVLDAGVFPAVSYPQEAGIDWDQLIAIVERLVDPRPPLGVSIADLNPGRDADGHLARQVVDRLAPVLRIPRG